MQRPGVVATIVGASKLAQFDQNVAATEIALSDDQLRRLNEISSSTPGFTASLASPLIRSMVFGGNDVMGWSN